MVEAAGRQRDLRILRSAGPAQRTDNGSYRTLGARREKHERECGAGLQDLQQCQAAFAGESQARNRYTFFASQARTEGYEQIANIFTETAGNEKEQQKSSSSILRAAMWK